MSLSVFYFRCPLKNNIVPNVCSLCKCMQIKFLSRYFKSESIDMCLEITYARIKVQMAFRRNFIPVVVTNNIYTCSLPLFSVTFSISTLFYFLQSIHHHIFAANYSNSTRLPIMRAGCFSYGMPDRVYFTEKSILSGSNYENSTAHVNYQV